MKNILIIVAAGKSSRFGGFPKTFCQIGDKTNVQNTIEKAKGVFDKVYVGLNRSTYDRFANGISGAEILSITTGQGDAHSVLKCIDCVRDQEKDMGKLMVCWGDAVFTSSLPFTQLIAGAGETKAAVACTIDDNPYAWFETNESGEILRAHFAKEEGSVKRGLHDQSLFLFDPEFAWLYLNKYRETLGIPYHNDESAFDANDTNEMKLLLFFEYLHNKGYNRAKCVEITARKVLSFNTQDELTAVKKALASAENKM